MHELIYTQSKYLIKKEKKKKRKKEKRKYLDEFYARQIEKQINSKILKNLILNYHAEHSQNTADRLSEKKKN